MAIENWESNSIAPKSTIKIPKMLQCLSLKSSSSSTNSSAPPRPPPPQNSHGNSTEAVSPQPSPTNINFSREYTLTVQTNSFSSMRSKIHHLQSQLPEQNGEIHHHSHSLLDPNKECVEEALLRAKTSPFTTRVKDYFDHSENTTTLCLLLHLSVIRARALYSPLQTLLEVLNLDSSLSQSQCDHIFNLLVDFDRLDNPFPSPDSHNFNQMHQCYSDLKPQLDRRLRKSCSRIRLIRHATTGPALCFICTAAGVDYREVAGIAQLEAATRGTYKLDEHLVTINCLVDRIRDAVDNHKFLIRFVLERGNEKHPIQMVMKRLQIDQVSIQHTLEILEEHINLCFITINRARALLLQEIYRHQSSMSRDCRHRQGADLATNSHENFVYSTG
ncbi:UPF0496 protein At3g19330 [Quercus robur]|uniref:UPF0496 protein At3g19330 n=1 Tax=Quercus robur TaxID=38942 RepID=UPI0021637BD6|nr:UPF0496 protein At3g19330 [Quercus robur]XP_050270611.1 UPF0496 protein At3g19330 [Quercus robur]XP_050270612.1 UPF0496 protein At3g19330 [Quercus robur]XP_050270613.1 UPF0496 protein At3g19330 [Quercus robur]XP_050270614.1 UPF0496 protein At3g19330 [Quercus robur]